MGAPVELPGAYPGAYTPGGGSPADSRRSTPPPIVIDSPFDLDAGRDGLLTSGHDQGLFAAGPSTTRVSKHLRNASLPTPSNLRPGHQYPLCGSNFLQHLRGHSKAHYTSFPFSGDPSRSCTPIPSSDEATPSPRYWQSIDSANIPSAYANAARPRPRPPIHNTDHAHPGAPPLFTDPFACTIPDHTEVKHADPKPTAAYEVPTRDRSASAASLSIPDPGGLPRRRSTPSLCRIPILPHEPRSGEADDEFDPPSPATTVGTIASANSSSDGPSRRTSEDSTPSTPSNRSSARSTPRTPPKAIDEMAPKFQLQRPAPGASRMSETSIFRCAAAKMYDEPATLQPRYVSSSSGELLTRRVSGHLKNLAQQKATSWNEFAFAYSQGWFDPLRTPLFPDSGPEMILPAAAPSTPRLVPVEKKHIGRPRAHSAPTSPISARRELACQEDGDEPLNEDPFAQFEPTPEPTPPPVPRVQRKQSHSRSSSELGPPPIALRRMIEDSHSCQNIRQLHEVRPFYEKYGFLPAPLPPHEPERLKALYSFNILYTSNDLNFDRIVHMIKLVFNSRMAFLSLLDGEKNWYKSYSGLGYCVSHLRRSVGFCAHVVLTTSEEPFVVLDTHKDWRFRNNPIVTGPTGIRFYAGAPLRTSDGYNIGVLCVVDYKPRTEFSPRSRHILKEFAAIVMRELELWRDRLQLRMRDRIQKSIEEFTRECLENPDDEVSGANDVDNYLAHVYQRAGQVIKETLDLDGCTILDISQFERVEVRNPDGGSPHVMYHANPYTGGGQHSFTNELNTEFGKVAALPILSSTSDAVTTHPLSPSDHKLVSQFLAEYRDGRIFSIAPSWIRSVIPPSIKYAMVVPIAGIDHQPFALICAHTHDQGKQFLEGFELGFLRGIGAIILSAVLRRRTVLADRSKNVLISSVSHELRTPLHGMLAAGELLGDTPLDTNQEAFLATLRTCGLQLIETVNHVLDFAKLSIEGKDKSTSQIQFRRVNLAELIHSTVEGCWLGQRARSMQMTDGDNDIGSFYAPEPKGLIPYDQRLHIHQHLAHVESVLDIGFREKGWNVICETGGLRRIIMNLYNNSLKFTEKGYVQIMLRELPHPPDQTRIPVELRVIDTGKGIGKSFLKNQMFQPFAQENPLQPGTGLGLAIVANIVTSNAMGGNLKVYSAENVGTEIRIQFEVETVDDDEEGEDIVPIDTTMGQGYRIAFVNYSAAHRGHQLQQEVMTHYAHCLGFQTTDTIASADIVVVNEASGVTPSVREACRGRALLLVISFNDNATLEAMGRTDAYTGILYKPMGIEHFTRGLQAAVKWINDPTNPELLGTVAQLNKAAEHRRLHGHGGRNCMSMGVSAMAPTEQAKMMQILGHRPRTPLRDISPSPSPPTAMSPGQADTCRAPCLMLPKSPETCFVHPTPASAMPASPMSPINTRFTRQNSLEPLRPSPTRTLSAPSTPTSLVHSSDDTPTTPTTPSTIMSPIMEQPAAGAGSCVSGFSTVSIADGGVMLSSCQHHGPVTSLRSVRPPRIMVVEDNPINRRVLGALLKKRKFEYTEAVDGQAGVDLFKNSPPNYWDAILMDITMPVMDGLEATRAIRHIETLRRAAQDSPGGLGSMGSVPADSPLSSPTSFTSPPSPISPTSKTGLGPPFDVCTNHHVKIFALTGLATSTDKRKAFASGVDGYLVKPVSLSTMDLLFKKIGF